MIRIACTNCKTILSIDDAFAGGVCRCQHCGTIQTVPAAKSGAVGQTVSGPKAIYRANKSDGPGTGLDELAEIVASSGLSGSGLTSRRLTKQPPADPPPKQKNMFPIYIAVSGVFLLLLIIIIWLATRGNPAPSATAVAPAMTPAITISTPISPSEPSFCGINLNASSVIYLLDRGSATQEYFAALKDATLKSAASLGSNRKFQIIFWKNGSDSADPVSYPQDSTAYATADNVTAAQRTIDDVFASGASDVKPSFEKALLRNPEVIVIATAKAYSLDDAWAQSIMDLRGSSPVKIDILSLGSDTPSAVLKSLAEKTGGTYLDVDANTLRTFAGH